MRGGELLVPVGLQLPGVAMGGGQGLRVPPEPLSAPVYTVVLHLKNELNRGTFFMTLQNQPVALSLYRQVGAVPAVTPS